MGTAKPVNYFMYLDDQNVNFWKQPKEWVEKHHLSLLLLSSPVNKLQEACHYKPALKRLGEKMSKNSNPNEAVSHALVF